MRQTLVIYCATFAVLWLMVAFISAIPNPMEWVAGARFMFTVVGFIIGTVCSAAHYDSRQRGM